MCVCVLCQSLVAKNRMYDSASMQLLTINHLLKFRLNVQGVNISESELRMKKT